ncbi:alpha/beta fold hydrolase [Actinoplanes sp. NPDC051470]|uniref:thioesterase II family protein n=1 Tax=unclassified Actinoplanes TaxID=2626549 RepID=UPI00341FD990
MTDRRWVRDFHPAPQARVRLICLPHAGGSASTFLPLSADLAPAVDVLAIQYPGRQDRLREPCLEDIPQLARRVFEALRPVAGVTPTALFGHSMGATVAFELARLMEAAGTAPVRLFASARLAPSRNRREPVDSLSDQELLAQLRLLGGTDQGFLLDDDLMSLALPAIRSDYRAVDRYVCTAAEPLRCPVSVLVGDGDAKVTPMEATAWREHTRGEFDLSTFPGGHFYLAEQRAGVAKLVQERLGVLV